MNLKTHETGINGRATTGLTVVARGLIKFLESRIAATAAKRTSVEDLLIKNGKFAGTTRRQTEAN